MEEECRGRWNVVEGLNGCREEMKGGMGVEEMMKR